MAKTAQRAINYKVYFVEAPSPEENCFVVSTDKASAARLEEDGSGFDRGDCTATFVRDVEPKWLKRYFSSNKLNAGSRSFYLYEEYYKELDIIHTVLDGDDFYTYKDK
jgi:hypothetical protein